MESYVIYRGPSQLDGSPIMAILTMRTANRKTGPMAQLWILRSDIEPHIAEKNGQSSAVCGTCPLQRNGCYVLTHQAPLGVYRAAQRGKYIDLTDGPGLFTLAEILRGKSIRLGAYGDPAALPINLVEWVVSCSAGHTGYSHQLLSMERGLADRWAAILMCSCDTPAQAIEATRRGWRYFLTVPAESSAQQRVLEIIDREIGKTPIHCPADSVGITCEQCQLCAGTSRPARSIFIPVHGRSKNRFLSVHAS